MFSQSCKLRLVPAKQHCFGPAHLGVPHIDGRWFTVYYGELYKSC
jgi:hypothetical protein